MVRRIAEELREFDNATFEICNEPYATKPRVPDDWQRHMTEVLAKAMQGWSRPFLISWNIANKSAKVTNPPPAVSLFNFHYAVPPDTVGMNWELNRPIGDNETGFRGTNDAPYRTEAWDFILAGGALFNHLDYSFTVGHEDGTHQMTATTPGGGNSTLRRQFAILREFVNGLAFIKMKPDNSIIKGGIPSGGSARALVEPGRACAIYLHRNISPARGANNSGAPSPPDAGPIALQIELSDGRWRAEWIDTKTGKTAGRANVTGGNSITLNAPPFETDIALRIVRR
jgi:hypothetical protein